MKTLKELFEKHGSVWLAHNSDPSKKAFKPMGYSECKTRLIGEGVNCDTFYPSEAKIDSTDLLIYKEPKKKKIYYQYAIKYKKVKMPLLTHGMYSEEKEFMEASEDFAYLEGQEIEWIKRIEPGVEVEE